MSEHYRVLSEIPHPDRSLRLIRRAIAAFDLDLHDLTVLTEAASGPFVLTPMIAALAGARSVHAITRDSRYGSAAEVTAVTREVADHLQVADRIDLLTARDDERLGDCDVVTNLGFVRPIDSELLQRVGPYAAVTLMCEPWEVRPDDVDLEACRTLGIPVLGTNEEDERLQTFSYLPLIVAKLLFELEVEVFGSHLVVVSSGKFADALCVGLEAMGAESKFFAPPLSAPDPAFESAVAAADALVVADYPGTGPLIGPSATCRAADLVAANPGLALVHLCGDVSPQDVEQAGLRHAPARLARAGTMSVTAGYLGPRPVVDLHCAGLAIGAALARARRRGLGRQQAEAEVLQELPVARGFLPHAMEPS